LWVQTRLYYNYQLLLRFLPRLLSPTLAKGIGIVNVPGASSLAVGSWARVPDGFVRHVGSTWYCICSWKLGCLFAMKWRRVTDRAECEVVEVSRWILLDWLDSWFLEIVIRFSELCALIS
jgi:hypothetical protein